MHGITSLSLVRYGARHHVAVSVALLFVLPLLCLVLIFGAPQPNPAWLDAVLGGSAILFGVFGYVLLRRYPRNLARLRHYLESISTGTLPERVILDERDNDVESIQRLMNVVVGRMRGQVRSLEEQLQVSVRMQETIKAQTAELVSAEQQRAMIESLAAACHHIGQPAMVLSMQIELLRMASQTPETRTNLDECKRTMDEIARVLNRLRAVSEFRTVPYCTFSDGRANGEDRILDVPADGTC